MKLRDALIQADSKTRTRGNHVFWNHPVSLALVAKRSEYLVVPAVEAAHHARKSEISKPDV